VRIFLLTMRFKKRVICKYRVGITLKATYTYNKWNNKEENTNQTQTCSSLNLFFFTYPFPRPSQSQSRICNH